MRLPAAPPAPLTSAFLSASGGAAVVDASAADVGRTRERRRQWRMVRVALVVLALVLGVQAVAASAVLSSIDWTIATPMLFFVVLLLTLGVTQLATGRSPHVLLRPEQIDVRLSDVVGLEPVKEDVVRSLNLFLAHRTFARQMGGTPRRGLLFEGPPGTGKTHTAKAMAAEAGVPFLFATATSFQSSFYGATARKIRTYFKELRKAARREGGAIGFIDEFDAIGGTRAGLSMRAADPAGTVRAAVATSDLAGPVVNELLVQMQSIDTPLGAERFLGWLVAKANLLLPAGRQLRGPAGEKANILVVASTNRVEGLDPALLRPGRFDRRLRFELPDLVGRRAMVDHVLARKAHDPELDADERRDALAAVTVGFSPVAIEHLLDEALVNAVRRGSTAMSWRDVETARVTATVGLASPVGYTAHEARLISTHEAGHAVTAHLVAPQRRLEVLTMRKRAGALGMLAHGDRADVYTRSRSELLALMDISFGGSVAEELFFGEVSTGPASDLAYATTVAAQMVGAAGMAGSLVSFEAVPAGAFGEGLVGRVLGDAAARDRVEVLLAESRARVVALLGESRDLVAALRDALLAREELIGSEITQVLEQAAADAGGGDAEPAVIDLREPAPTPH